MLINLLLLLLLLLSPNAAYSAAKDWRDVSGTNYVTVPKEQGRCRTCWAFASVAALESQLIIQGVVPDNTIDLSEQALVSCGGVALCSSSGSEGTAIDYLQSDGVPIDAYAPYDGSYQNDTTCNTQGYGPGDAYNFQLDWDLHTFKVNGHGVRIWTTVSQMKSDIDTYGPIVAEMYYDSTFSNYSGGIYEFVGPSIGGHVVLIIGYDDEDGDDGAFIIKNSFLCQNPENYRDPDPVSNPPTCEGSSPWGETYGGKYGYARISYTQAECTAEDHSGSACLNHQITYLQDAVRTSNEYYVDEAGSSGDGTKGNPWAPSEIPWSTFESGTINTFLYFMEGTYADSLAVRHDSQTNRLYIKPCSSSIDSADCDGLVFFQRAYGNILLYSGGYFSDNVTIDGETTPGSGTRNIKVEATNLAVASAAIDGGSGYDHTGISIQYVYFYGARNTAGPPAHYGDPGYTGATGYIVRITDSDGTDIGHNLFYDNWCHAEVYVTPSNSSPSYGEILVHHNTFQKGSLNSVSCNGNIDIYSNTFDLSENPYPYDVIHLLSQDSGDGVGLHNIRFWNNYIDTDDQMIFFENNTITGCSGSPCPTEDIYIWNNVFTCTNPQWYDSTFNGGKGIIFKDTTARVEGEVCLSKETAVVDSVYITHNTFVNVQKSIGGTGPYLYSTVEGPPVSCGSSVAIDNSAVYDNFVFVNNVYYEGSSESGYDTSAMVGNFGSPVYWASAGDFLVDYNYLYDNDAFQAYMRPAGTGGAWAVKTTLSAWNGATGPAENNGSNVSDSDPGFAETTYFTLAAGSYLIGKADDLSVYGWYWSALAYDKAGNPRPTGSSWDIGAYQYGGGLNFTIGSGSVLSLGSGAVLTLQ